MASDRVRVKARIRFLSSKEGGRASPLLGGGSYRPNHRFFPLGELSMGFIELPKNKQVRPGETIEAEVTFIPYQAIEGELRVGREWHIQEGPKLVALGTILEIIG